MAEAVVDPGSAPSGSAPNAGQLEYSKADLLSEVRYDEPLFAGDVRFTVDHLAA